MAITIDSHALVNVDVVLAVRACGDSGQRIVLQYKNLITLCGCIDGGLQRCIFLIADFGHIFDFSHSPCSVTIVSCNISFVYEVMDFTVNIDSGWIELPCAGLNL